MTQFISDNQYDKELIEAQLHHFQCDKEILSILKEVPVNGFGAANHVEMSHRLAYDTRAMVWEMRTWLLAKSHIVGKQFVPTSWWQHFKRDVLPQWMQRRFRWVRPHQRCLIEKITHVCPHADVKFPPGDQVHYAWMESVGKNCAMEECLKEPAHGPTRL